MYTDFRYDSWCARRHDRVPASEVLGGPHDAEAHRNCMAALRGSGRCLDHGHLELDSAPQEVGCQANGPDRRQDYSR